MAPRTCAGITKKGKRCRRKPVADGFCRIHHTPEGDAGRPRDLTPELQENLLTAIRAGALLKEAAAAVGIGESTLHEWRQRGEGEAADPQFADFAEAVTRARAEAKVGAIAAIRLGMKDDWRAAAWWLERTDFERFGRRTRHEHTGGSKQDDAPLRISHELLTDPAIRDDLGSLKRRVADSRAERAERPGPGGGSDPPSGRDGEG